MGRLVCAIQSNWIKSKPTVLVQHIGYLSSHPRKLMMIKYEFSSSPQCSWGSRSDVSSTKWGSTRTSPPRHTPCHVARGKYYQFNCVFECLSICIFFYKKIALLFMLIFFSFRRSFDGDLPVLTCYLTRWCCHCHSLSAWTKSPEVERTSFWEREAWKVYLDDGQFEKLDKVVADCENANDNNEPTARHLKHE